MPILSGSRSTRRCFTAASTAKLFLTSLLGLPSHLVLLVMATLSSHLAGDAILTASAAAEMSPGLAAVSIFLVSRGSRSRRDRGTLSGLWATGVQTASGGRSCEGVAPQCCRVRALDNTHSSSVVHGGKCKSPRWSSGLSLVSMQWSQKGHCVLFTREMGSHQTGAHMVNGASFISGCPTDCFCQSLTMMVRS